MRKALVVSLIIAASALLAVDAAAASAPSTAGLAAKAPACAGKTKKAATKAIEKSYDMVLNGTVERTLDQKFAFVEGSDKPEFRALLDDIAAKNAGLLATTSVKVNSVTCTGKKSADVAFDLVLNGSPSPGLAPPGAAVLDGKTWKMSSLTVCDLFSLSDPALVDSGPCADLQAGG